MACMLFDGAHELGFCACSTGVCLAEDGCERPASVSDCQAPGRTSTAASSNSGRSSGSPNEWYIFTWKPSYSCTR